MTIKSKVMDNNTLYQRYLEEKEAVFESICSRCGACCGANDDPCNKLKKDHVGSFYCSDYENRLGSQNTVSGKPFNCVSIRKHIKEKTLPARCKYRDRC